MDETDALRQQVLALQQELLREREKTTELSRRLEERQASETALRQAPSRTQDKADLENALEAEQEYIMHKLNKQLEMLQRDKLSLQHEKQQLKGQVRALGGSVNRLTQEKVDLEKSLELEEEAFINSLMRQVAGMMQNYQAMEKAMRQHGLKITQTTSCPPSPTMDPGSFLARVSASSNDAYSNSGSGRRSASRTAAKNSTFGSPGAQLSATREQMNALNLAKSGEMRSSVRARVRRQDSISSLSSSLSAMSRDVSISRDSASVSGHAAQCAAPAAQQDAPRGHP